VYDPIGIAAGMRQHLSEEPAGLIALTTHARSGMQRIRLGAAAADIVRNATAPALVVPLPA
jgi:nucleotide-binding universal stress UspA family protein